MSAGFEEFTRAATQRASSGTAEAPAYRRIAVLGGGADARLLAALALAEGATDGTEVTLFSAYGAELAALRSGAGIALRGAGPVGSYQLDRPGPSIRTTAELDGAVAGADLVILTGPIHKQRTYAMVLADHLQEGQTLLLAPGRSLGAVETAWLLRMGGATADVTIVELQGLPYWYRAEGAQLHLSEAGPFCAATLPAGRTKAIAGLARLFGAYTPCDSVLASGFADLSAAVELPALALGGMGLRAAGQDLPDGARPLPENDTFAALIGPSQQQIIAQLAEERRTVAAAFGVRDLPQTDAWIASYAGAVRGEGARPVPDRDAARALLRDGVIGSLVPLVSAADLAGCAVPMTRAMITLTEGVLGADVAAAGRRLDTIGLTSANVDQARRAFDALGNGGK